MHINTEKKIEAKMGVVKTHKTTIVIDLNTENVKYAQNCLRKLENQNIILFNHKMVSPRNIGFCLHKCLFRYKFKGTEAEGVVK